MIDCLLCEVLASVFLNLQGAEGVIPAEDARRVLCGVVAHALTARLQTGTDTHTAPREGYQIGYMSI